MGYVLILLYLSFPPGILVDRAVAVVDKEVITYSELLRETRIALVLSQGVEIASNKLPEKLVASFLDYLINQIVVSIHARRLGDIDVSHEDVEREKERFSQRFNNVDAYRAFLRRFDISEDALGSILRRDLRNERYIEQRTRIWKVRGDKQVSAEDYQKALRRWLRQLKVSVELRVLSPEGELELQ